MSKFIHSLYGHKLVGRDSLKEMTSRFTDKFPGSYKGLSMFNLRGINKDAASKQGGIDAFTYDIVYVSEDKFAFALPINGHNYPKGKIFWSVMDIYYNRPVEIPSFSGVTLALETLRR